MLAERTGVPLAEIAERVDALIVTLGGDGSVIHAGGETFAIPAAKPAAVLDPTGCGDAYRAGFLYGLAQGWDWQRTGGLASVARRAENRVARCAESRGQPGDGGSAVSRDVRHRLVVSFSADAACGGRRRRGAQSAGRPLLSVDAHVRARAGGRCDARCSCSRW